MRFIIPFPSTWFRISVLYGLSFAVCLSTLYLFHQFSYLALGHAIAHALVIPTMVYWFLDTLLYGQQFVSCIITCFVVLHPGYFVDATVPFSTCGISAALLLFLILAMNTFNFAWCELPRHVIESTLLYAPEMGFLTLQYDHLIDEIGYNEWYARYRTLWLIAIGFAWGGLMTISLYFIFLGLMLFVIYGYTSSTFWSMIKKIIKISFPAAFILILLYFASPASYSWKNLQPHFDFEFLRKLPLLIFMPSNYLLQSVNIEILSKKMCLWRLFAFELFFGIGFLGVLGLLIKKNVTVRQVVKVLPFLFLFTVVAVLERDSILLWVMYPTVMALGGIFWVEILRPYFDNRFV